MSATPREPRSHCVECGEELWGYSEACGLCVLCQQRSNDHYDDYGDDDGGDEAVP